MFKLAGPTGALIILKAEKDETVYLKAGEIKDIVEARVQVEKAQGNSTN